MVFSGEKKQKPTLSFWEIWNMSFGFLGIQFGFGLQNANVSRIFETLGAAIDDIAILWIAAPLTGLIVQPIIGYLSDRTWSEKWGRRRPFFLIGAILASASLLLMPNSPTLWIAAGMLWIMDSSINITMEPFRAFVGDNLPDKQRTIGFATQSFFIGIGAVVSSLMPYILTNWFDVANTAPEGVIPPSVKWSFYIGGAVFLLAVLWTVYRAKEYSPQELASFDDGAGHTYAMMLSPEEEATAAKSKLTIGAVLTAVGAGLMNWVNYSQLDKQLFILGGFVSFVGILAMIAGYLQRNKQHNALVQMADDLQFMPKTMKQLAVVQFFSWFALFAMWIYTTSSVTRTVYDMNITPEVVNVLEKQLEKVETDVANLPIGNKEEIATKEKETEKISSIKEELNDLKKTFGMGISETPTSLSLASYFLNNRILNEKDILISTNPSAQKSQMSTAAKAEMTSLLEKHQDNIPTNDDQISYATFKELTEKVGGQNTPSMSTILTLKRVQKEYNNGGDQVGIWFAIYNLVAAMVAFLIPVFAKKIGRKMTHLIFLVLGGLGLISISMITTPEMGYLSMIGVGFAWASILAIPYAILTGVLPAQKMGYYMGVFNFFIVIPQLVAAAILGGILSSFFNSEPIYALIIGGASLILAGILTLRVDDKMAEKS